METKHIKTDYFIFLKHNKNNFLNRKGKYQFLKNT